MKKTITTLLLICLTALVVSSYVGCLPVEGGGKIAEKRKLIIDVDMAADDATALLLAAADESVEILGVTVAAGNVSLNQAVKNTLMTLEIAGKSKIPVFQGAETPINGVEKPTFSVFGEDGMGDMNLIHPSGKASDVSAVDFILNTLKEYPGEVEIVCLAPATNLAECIRRDAETMKLVKHIWSMGTAGLGPGNATPVAEFNVYKDVDAYKILLDAELPMTIIGLDMDSEETYLTEQVVEKMKKTGGANEFIAKAFQKLAENNLKTCGYAFGDCPDGVAMACVLWENFVKSSVNTHAVCITDSDKCYGQVIFYREKVLYDTMVFHENYNTVLITDADRINFTDRMIKELNKLK
ncbi:MAG: nucleoside hydrolase [Synergistes sp.]|nr:nucleoside hydrolase [Synergistes sp.]